MKLQRVLVTIFVMLALTVITVAHHSNAGEFDPNGASLTLAGVITKVELRNPHSNIYLDVTDPKTGKTENWRVEYGDSFAYYHLDGSAPIRQPLPNGVVLKSNSAKGVLSIDERAMFGGLRPGAAVSVTGVRANDGSLRISFKTLRDEQGKTIIG